MSRIRKLCLFDKKKIYDMVSFLNNETADSYLDKLIFNPLLILHYILPLKLKYLPESYVLKDGKDIKGLITVAPIGKNTNRIEIKKLFFEETSYNVAIELVQYVVSKYKAMGASSIMVKVDDCLPELITTFISKCNFCQISYEKLWRINRFPELNYNKKVFRSFSNSDAKAVVNLYNDSLLPHFRPFLGKSVREFEENIFKGLSLYSNFSYVIEEEGTKNIIGYITIQTFDNENFIINFIQSNWVEIDVNMIIKFASDKILKRKKKFGLFIKTNRYTNFGNKYEKTLMEQDFECLSNQALLTNSSAKLLESEAKSGKYTLVNDFYPTKIMPV
ncbi:hypothetical protein IJO12_04230 [bacterium]|nr:hypothetical protein [bacterium]